jgi:hypothetical protein
MSWKCKICSYGCGILHSVFWYLSEVSKYKIAAALQFSGEKQRQKLKKEFGFRATNTRFIHGFWLLVEGVVVDGRHRD